LAAAGRESTSRSVSLRFALVCIGIVGIGDIQALLASVGIGWVGIGDRVGIGGIGVGALGTYRVLFRHWGHTGFFLSQINLHVPICPVKIAQFAAKRPIERNAPTHGLQNPSISKAGVKALHPQLHLGQMGTFTVLFPEKALHSSRGWIVNSKAGPSREGRRDWVLDAGAMRPDTAASLRAMAFASPLGQPVAALVSS
jgi:hypothetical protein